jgi:hypothetical protein
MAAGSTYEPIATTTLGSAQAQVDFNSFGGYTDLILITNLTTAANTSVTCRVGNGSLDTGTNYSYTLLDGNGSTARSARDTNGTSGFITGHYVQITAGNNVQTITHFQNYANTSTFKTWVTRGAIPAQFTDAGVGLWRSTSAITVMRLFNNTGANFAAGSTFTLYGIAAA